MAVLRYYDSSGTWQEKEFNGNLTIGRGADSDLQLNDAQISGKHLLLQDQPQGMLVTDLGSTNGTWVNGAALKPQTPYRVNPGQEIRIGGCVLQVIQAIPMPAPTHAGQPFLPVRKKKSPLWAVFIGGAALLLCCGVVGAVVVFSGLLALPTGSSTVTQPVSVTSIPAAQLPPAVLLTSQDETKVTSDSGLIKDSRDVAVTVPAGSMQGSGGVVMTAWLPPDSFDANLKKYAFERKSSLYSLKVDGSGDNMGGAALSFPAASPDDRLAALLDQRFIVVLGVLPQDGRLVVTASVKPGGITDAIEGGGTAYFVVAEVGSAQNRQPSPFSLASGAALPSGAAYPRLISWAASASLDVQQDFCDTNIDASNAPLGRSCWNQDRSIFYAADAFAVAPGGSIVNVNSEFRLLDEAAKIGQSYGAGGLGIQHIPTTSDPLYIVMDNSSLHPNYYSATGKIYLPRDDVSKMDNVETQQMLAHEMFHWIEHRTYPMSVLDGLLGYSNDPWFIWEMETRAEAATFLINPEFQTVELRKRGAATPSDANPILGWQEAAADWPTEMMGLRGGLDPARYVHGIMVRMGICTGGEACKSTPERFAADINQGTFKMFSDANANVLPNTAKYLLGFAPEDADYGNPGVDFSVPDLQTGRGYGDFIHVGMAGSEYVSISSSKNQSKSKDTGIAKINAEIGRRAIYPLRVSNGADYPVENEAYRGLRLLPNVPYSLTIESGVAFFYREGSGGWQYSDGSTGRVFEPITSAASVTIEDEGGALIDVAGIPVLRLVAVNPNPDSVTLRGTFEPMAPLFSVNPQVIKIQDLATPVKLEINGARVFPNIKSFNVLIEYNDGTAPTSLTATTNSDGTVQVTDSHKFSKKDVNSVTISFKDINGGALGWPDLVVPVLGGGAAGRPAFNIIGVEILFGNTNYDPNYSYLNKTISMKGTVFATTPDAFIQGAVSADYKTITVVLQANDHNIQLNDIPLLSADNYNKTYQYGVCTAAAILPHVLQDGSTPDWKPEAGSEGRECVMIYLAQTP